MIAILYGDVFCFFSILGYCFVLCFFICLLLFAFPSFQKGVVAEGCLVGDSSGILPDVATGFLCKSVSRYWELIISFGDGLRKGVSVPSEGRKIKVLY